MLVGLIVTCSTFAHSSHAGAIDDGGDTGGTNMQRHTGYCAATVSGYQGNCTHGALGSMSLPNDAFRNRHHLEKGCIEACRQCKRCTVVSWSLSLHDCSWFHECSLDELHNDVPGFTSQRVRNRSSPSARSQQQAMSHFSMLRALDSPEYIFPSQEGQDSCLVENVFKWRTNGYYIDLAANSAKFLSNTYALDRLYNWSGLCIEPQARYVQEYVRSRTCVLGQVLVGDGRTVHFRETMDGYKNYGASHVDVSGADPSIGRPSQLRKTVPLSTIFSAAKVPSTIDYMSLDIEGYEYFVMRLFPWGSYSIKVLTVERPGIKLHSLLMKHGYCVAHNAASYDDIMYFSHGMAHISTAKCKRAESLPPYVATSDICKA